MMPYPRGHLGKTFFLSFATLFLSVRGACLPCVDNFLHSAFPKSHNFRSYTLYQWRDTVQERWLSAYVRQAANGDLIITVPQTPAGRYKIRFFDERSALLFEIRQIRDPLLIVEKYNFEHAGQFRYELYRDSVLIEKKNLLITQSYNRK